MRTVLFVSIVSLAGLHTAARGDEPGRPLKVCILSGCNTYDSESSLPPFQEFLTRNYQVQCTRVVRRATDDLPGLEQLEDCDVALVFIKRMQLQGDQLQRFKSYVTSGKPIVAVRTASHAVQTWLEFDKQVLGGNYRGHHPSGPVTTIEAAEGAPQHPILRGVKLTTAGESLYKNAGHAADIQVLLRGSIPGQPTEALAWTREYQGGRVFYTSLGGQETFQKADFRRLLANALFWTAGREVAMKQP
jgi:type 1 glutamine amidotransferase